MTTTHFEKKGPIASGEELHNQHSQLFAEALGIEGAIPPRIRQIHSDLHEQGLLIQTLEANLNLTLSQEDLAAATKPTAEEIIKIQPGLGS